MTIVNSKCQFWLVTGYYWWQYTGHMCHPILACSDFELMEPVFRMYENARVLAEDSIHLHVQERIVILSGGCE